MQRPGFHWHKRLLYAGRLPRLSATLVLVALAAVAAGPANAAVVTKLIYTVTGGTFSGYSGIYTPSTGPIVSGTISVIPAGGSAATPFYCNSPPCGVVTKVSLVGSSGSFHVTKMATGGAVSLPLQFLSLQPASNDFIGADRGGVFWGITNGVQNAGQTWRGGAANIFRASGPNGPYGGGGIITGVWGTLYTITGGFGHRFTIGSEVRTVLAPVDTDGDGFDDADEVDAGTDPNDPSNCGRTISPIASTQATPTGRSGMIRLVRREPPGMRLRVVS